MIYADLQNVRGYLQMKKATLKSDVWLNGYGVLKAGTRYPVEKANTRYAYLQLQPRLTARVKRSDIVLK